MLWRPLLQVDSEEQNGRLRARLACCLPHWELLSSAASGWPWRRGFPGSWRGLPSAVCSGSGLCLQAGDGALPAPLSLSPTTPFSSGPGAR